MDCSIIILTKNGGANFPRLLEKIFQQCYQGILEVMVIDSGSTDNTLDIANQYPVEIIQIKPEEFHHSRTRNLGAESAHGNILVYITQDALPVDNDWLNNLAKPLEDPGIGMVCGRQIPWPNVKPCEKFFYHYYFPEFKISANKDSADCYHDNMFISNVNSAISKDIWHKHKFGESLILGEDKEFAARLLKAGLSIVYEPSSPVYHAHDSTLKAIFYRSIDAGIALKQGVSALPRSRTPFIERAIDYLVQECKYLLHIKKIFWYPYCILYELTKFIGVLLGKSGFFSAQSIKISKNTK